jgi:6,7-dimethyl-8-ribityllumazine synthase
LKGILPGPGLQNNTMAGKKQNLSFYDESTVPDASGLHIPVVVADWNPGITGALLEGTLSCLEKYGLKRAEVPVYRVPGSFELTAGAALAIRNGKPDAVICLGCVIQGETRHFEFIAQAVANGCTQLSANTGIPVIFGVLTTDTYDQALERAGGKHGNKGDEAAITAIKMAALKHQLTPNSQ